jgi:hypothetical protein
MASMLAHTCRGRSAVLLLALAAGCGKPVDPAPPEISTPPEAEGQVRVAFTALQAAFKAADPDKLWDLLSSKSHTDAEQTVKGLRESYEKADADGKAKLAKDLGLPGEKVARLTGPGFLATKRFRDKYDEIADGKVTKVTVQGDSATVYFDEPDGDHEKCIFLREDGRWKAWLTMPKPKPQP